MSFPTFCTILSLFCRLEPMQDRALDSIFRFQFSACEVDVGGSRLSKFTANRFNKNPDTRFEIAKRQANNDRSGWYVMHYVDQRMNLLSNHHCG